ncbi:TonB-dependent receptor plug domain-containing protein [Chryseosolibacter indicus]|uniref:TonB-dependent receptor n=1 Tax=Chryseosolibacter indicus TaxID=2782351 RepID=A0ABS5VRI0_9BACT|nr:TonB-dependent receptor [Chryseosolibacter indicus]MBT1704055.1 TonB-dependent receptor [Chryseosolibacter indicus]
MNNFTTWLMAGLLLVTGTSAFSQEQKDSTDLYALSLEELLSIKVISSTKTEVSIQKAPSVVRLFTKDDISKMGFQTLRDLLDQIPGFENQEYRAGHQLTWIRGVQARYNNKVLLLIDGVPIRDSYYGNFNVDEMIPIEIVERVEVINGPGSVLYGTNSFAGVISITTKQEGRSLSAEAGSFNTYRVNGQYSIKGLFVNANLLESDGFSPDFNSDGKVREHDQSVSNKSIMASYNRNGLELTGSYTKYAYPYKYRDSKGDYSFERTPVYGSAAYTIKTSTNSSLKLHGFYNSYGFNIEKTKYKNATSNEIKEIATEELNSSLYGGSAEYFMSFSKNELLAGVSLLADHADDIHALVTNTEGASVNIRKDMIQGGKGTFTRSNLGFFLQDTYSINSKIDLTGGVRYDVLSDFENQFNYRIGLTGSFNKNWYGKALFGTAYRIPSYREYIDVISYNNQLKPEELRTIEAQIGYASNKMDINLTVYNNYYTNFINEVVVDSIQDGAGAVREVDDEVSFNFDNRSITGLELNGVLKPIANLRLLIGLSYKFNASEKMGGFGSNEIIYTSQEIDFNKRDLLFLSKFTGNFTASYLFAQRVTLALNGQYFSNRNTPSDYQSNAPDAVQNASHADGFVKFNLFANVGLYKGLSLKASVNNVFDTNIYSPPFGGQQDYDAQWPGRNVRIGLRYNF